MKITQISKNFSFLFILIAYSVFSQTHNSQNANYVGTWEYQSGKQVFRLKIWEDTMPNPYDHQYYLKGDYKLIEIDNGLETIIYKSNPDEEQNLNALNGVVINNIYSGFFNENHTDGFGLFGNFEITYLPTFEIGFRVVKRNSINIYPSGITPKTDFEVPNNIMLIKRQ